MAELGMQLSNVDRYFVGGNMFAIRGEIVMQYLTYDKIKSALKHLNYMSSFDSNWFGLMSRTYQRATAKRFEQIFSGAPGNSLAHHHGEGILRDAQIEHAWERVLSYFALHRKLNVTVFRQVSPFLPVQVMVLPTRMRARNRYFTALTCYSDSVRDFCLQQALAGECVMQPHEIGTECEIECDCVHNSRKPEHIRSQLAYLLNHLHIYRQNGFFTFVAATTQHYIDCIQSEHAARLFSFEREPVSVDAHWRLNACSRIVSVDGSQLFLTAGGNVIHIHDDFYHQTILFRASERVGSDAHIRLTSTETACKLVLSSYTYTWKLVNHHLVTVPCTDMSVHLSVSSNDVTLSTSIASQRWS